LAAEGSCIRLSPIPRYYRFLFLFPVQSPFLPFFFDVSLALGPTTPQVVDVIFVPYPLSYLFLPPPKTPVFPKPSSPPVWLVAPPSVSPPPFHGRTLTTFLRQMAASCVPTGFLTNTTNTKSHLFPGLIFSPLPPVTPRMFERFGFMKIFDQLFFSFYFAEWSVSGTPLFKDTVLFFFCFGPFESGVFPYLDLKMIPGPPPWTFSKPRAK